MAELKEVATPRQAVVAVSGFELFLPALLCLSVNDDVIMAVDHQCWDLWRTQGSRMVEVDDGSLYQFVVKTSLQQPWEGCPHLGGFDLKEKRTQVFKNLFS